MKTMIFDMLQLLDNYKHPKEDLMQTYITQRLDKSYSLYEQELAHSILYLENKHEKSIIKRLKSIDEKHS